MDRSQPEGAPERLNRILTAVTYSRVSNNGAQVSLDHQEQSCLQAARGQFCRIVERITDQADGCTLDRPGIQRLRQLLSEGTVDVVIAYSPDRLCRNQDQLDELLAEVEQAGVRLEFAVDSPVEADAR